MIWQEFLPYVIFSNVVLAFFVAGIVMRGEGKYAFFLPFFFFGFVLSIATTAMFYDVWFNETWILFRLLWLGCFLWLLGLTISRLPKV